MQVVRPPRGAADQEKLGQEMAAHVGELREAFASERTRPRAWRIQQLKALLRLLEGEQRAIIEALQADLGKPSFEAWLAEVHDAKAHVTFTLERLERWMRPRRVATAAAVQPARSQIVKEPLGVVLIIAPWNYPFALSISPLIGALAAGNCVVLKPSELAPKTSALLARLLPQYLDPRCLQVVEGGVPETTALLAQRFDHIFYTGNGRVGRIVMAAAAKHLTPVTLELGGKCPCILDADTDLAVSARRIAWAKFLNAGQTCVAPDYVLAHRKVYDRFLARLVRTVGEFWGDNPQKSRDYGRIVNAHHHARLMRLIESSGEVVTGGTADVADRYIAPTVLRDVHPDSPIMQEEIFGPVLPVLPVNDLEEAIAFVNARDKPLALYLFSRDAGTQAEVMARTSSGGMAINHAVVQLAVPELPFGGVGESGMGAYHGRASFDTFSHKKSVLNKPQRIDPNLVYPPYGRVKKAILKRLA